jgi:hypothetical protein
MTKTMILAGVFAVALVGCASEDQAASPDGLDIHSEPGMVNGTFTQDGVTINFEFTPSKAELVTDDGITLVSATLENGIEKVVVNQDFSNLPEGKLVGPLHDAIIEDAGVITCPGPRSWFQVVGTGYGPVAER